MDVTRAVPLLNKLLSLGLAVEAALTDAGYVIRVIGSKTTATGVAESFTDALLRASWRFTQG